jgi:hypothetical protein
VRKDGEVTMIGDGLSFARIDRRQTKRNDSPWQSGDWDGEDMLIMTSWPGSLVQLQIA